MGALGLPAIIPLRDLGPLPGDKLYHTVWKKGMRVVQDVDGTPIQPADMEIGQLVNGEPGDLLRGGRRGRARRSRASSCRPQKAKAAVIIVRMQPDDITPVAGPRELGRRRHPVLLQDLHPRRVPDLACGSSRPTTCCAPATSRPSTSPTTARSSSAPPPVRCRSYRLAVDDEGYLIATSDFTEPVGPSFWERDR